MRKGWDHNNKMRKRILQMILYSPSDGETDEGAKVLNSFWAFEPWTLYLL